MVEMKKILAAPGKRLAVVKANGAQVRSKRGALCITDEGLLDEASGVLLQKGPVAVEWSDFYAKQERQGDLVVHESATDKPAEPAKAKARGKDDVR
jgi:hypothetical protein